MQYTVFHCPNHLENSYTSWSKYFVDKTKTGIAFIKKQQYLPPSEQQCSAAVVVAASNVFNKTVCFLGMIELKHYILVTYCKSHEM